MAVDTRIASWLVAYRPEWLRADLLAGVSVAAVALPIAIAYSQLAGVPPVYGLYASLLPLVAYAFLGSSRQLIVAPDAATCTIVAAIVQLLIRASRPHDAVLGRVAETKSYHDRATHPQAECFPGLVIYRFDAALVFFNADHFKARLRSVVRDKALGAVRCVVIDAETIPYLDTTGAACLEQVRTELEATGITLAVAAAKNDVRNMLSRTGIAERIGHERMFHTLEAAVQALYNRNTNASG